MTDSIDFAPLLEKIVSFIDEGVLITDNKGNVLYQNPAAGKLLGQPDSTPIQKRAVLQRCVWLLVNKQYLHESTNPRSKA